MSRHIVISLGVLLTILLLILLLHRIHIRRQVQALRALRPEPRPSTSISDLPDAYAFTVAGDDSRPQIVDLERAHIHWVSNDVVMVTSESPDRGSNPYQLRLQEGGTPSVWGIDLDRPARPPRPRRLPLGAVGRGGAVVFVRSGYDAHAEGESMTDLPRYEEPPPGYDKAIEDGNLQGNMETGEPSSPRRTAGIPSTGGDDSITVVGRELPGRPEPAPSPPPVPAANGSSPQRPSTR